MEDAIKEVVLRVASDDAPFEVLSVRKRQDGNIAMVIHVKDKGVKDEGR